MAVFYPPQWLLSLFVKDGRLPFLVYQWYIVFHYLLGGVLMYAFLRQTKLSSVGALSGAIVFCFSGFMSLRIVNCVMVQVYAWLPLQLLCIDRLAKSASPWAWLALIGAMLLSLLGGHPQTTLYCWYLVTAYWLYRLYRRDHRDGQGWKRSLQVCLKTHIPRLAGSFALVLGLSAVIVLPAAENWSRTGRPRQTFASIADPSLPYHELLAMLVPNFYGISSYRNPVCAFWGYDSDSPTVAANPPGHGRAGSWQYWEFGAYAGQLLLLALLLFAFNWRQVADKRRVGFFLAIWFVAVWFMLGRYGGLFNLLYHVLPGLSLFRGPAKMSCVAMFAAAVLTGCFVDLARNEGRRLRLWPVSLLVAVYLALLIVLFFGGRILPDELRDPHNLAWSRQETLWALSLTILCASAILCTARCALRGARSIGACALVVISGVDFHHAYGKFGGSVNPNLEFSEDDELLQLKENREKLGYFRFGQVLQGRLSEGPVVDRNLAYFQDFLEVPEGYTTFTLDSIERFQATTNLLARLAIENIKLVAWEGPPWIDQHGLRVRTFELRTFDDLLPRARFFTSVRRYDSRNALLAALGTGELDWRKETAVWGPVDRDIDKFVRPSSSMDSNDAVRYISETPEMYSIHYNVSQPGVIFVSQPFYPGWIADTGRFKMIEVFGAFQGIIIPEPGRGEITVRFSPRVLKVGLFISVFSLLITVCAALRLLILNQKHSASSMPPPCRS